LKGYLLDTSVLSLMAPGRTGVAPGLAGWLRDHGEALFVSTITVAEVQQGICKLRRTGGEHRADLLTDWLGELIAAGADRIISFGTEAAVAAGHISDAAMSKGLHPGFADVAIAAVAKSHDLTLLTTNGRHFAPLDVTYSDPSAADFFASG